MHKSVSDCINRLQKNENILVSFLCFDGTFNSDTGFVSVPKQGEKPICAHAITIIGWDLEKEAFCFVNTWGSDWGDLGHGWLPFFYFENDLIREIYSMKY